MIASPAVEQIRHALIDLRAEVEKVCVDSQFEDIEKLTLDVSLLEDQIARLHTTLMSRLNWLSEAV